MLTRTNRTKILTLLEENPTWNIIDIGAGSHPIERATVATDIRDLSQHYDRLPIRFERCADLSRFEDNEFDFAFASHILEHVPDPIRFCVELLRIAPRGYIELPTPLFDNLIYGNPRGHIHWFFFDDIERRLLCQPRKDIIRPLIDNSEGNLLYPYFRQQMVLELYWERSIEIVMDREFYYRVPDDLFRSTSCMSYPSQAAAFRLGAPTKSRLGRFYDTKVDVFRSLPEGIQRFIRKMYGV